MEYQEEPFTLLLYAAKEQAFSLERGRDWKMADVLRHKILAGRVMQVVGETAVQGFGVEPGDDPTYIPRRSWEELLVS